MTTTKHGTLLPLTPPRPRSTSFDSPYRAIAPSLKALEGLTTDLQTRLDDQLADIVCFEDTARKAQESLARTIALSEEHGRLLTEQIAAARQTHALIIDPPPPPAPADVDAPPSPNSAIADLRRKVDDLTRAQRQVSIAPDEGSLDSLARQRQTTVDPTVSIARSTAAPSANILKTSNLPKFGGKDNENVDQFISKVTAVLRYSRAGDDALLQHLPLILVGRALTWFAGLSDAEQDRLATWEDWQAALRKAFYLPDHETTLRKRCLYRTLKKDETLSEYYEDKRSLQRYAFPHGTPLKLLLNDLMDGLPAHIRPLVKATMTATTDLEDMRRILLDLEPAIRRSGRDGRDSGSPSKTSDRFTDRGNTGQDGRAPPKGDSDKTSRTDKGKRAPPAPCPLCKGDHWKNDCPQNAKPPRPGTRATYSVQVPPTVPRAPLSGSNATPSTNSKWPQEVGPIVASANVAAVAMNVEPYHSSDVDPKYPGPTTELARAHRNCTPVFTEVRINHATTPHRCCIDSGSGISLIDADYHRKFLNHVRINPHASFRLQGLGAAFCSGWIEVELTFSSDDGPIVRPIALYVVPRLEAKVLVANDFLKPVGATIDFATERLSFQAEQGRVPITCTPTPRRDDTPSARIIEAYVIQPGHCARVPITITGAPTTPLTYLHPRDLSSDTFVARSIHTTGATVHCAQVVNLSFEPLVLKAGQEVGKPLPLVACTTGPMVANVHAISAFDTAIAEMDVNPELTADQSARIHAVLRKHPLAFAHGDRRLGDTDWVTMDIDTSGAPPVSQPPYHASPHGRKIIEDNIAQLLADDVIEESDSPWASPAILVRQKGKDRFCVDYRKLNEVTAADQYPLPRIDDILSQFSGKTFFTTFDANKGFNQIQVTKADRPKTAFRTHQGLHQYKRMPFGLRNGPSVFQRFMDKVLGRYKWQSVLVYIDDIIIYSPDFDRHLEDVDRVLALTEKSGLTLSPPKSHIAYPSIKALGHSVSNLGIGTAVETVRAVSDFPTPRNIKALQRFLGLAVYYRRFIKDFSKVAAPLYALLKKDSKWYWDQGCSDSFSDIKTRLTSAPILAHPDYTKPFILHTDASTVGLGAVLSQLDSDKLEHPIIFLSRSLTDAEKNYTATELECLAIIWAIRKLHPYLDGSNFTLITDHSALQWLFDYNGSNKRIVRWTMDLQPYRPHMTIRYKPGRVHSNADPLSRAPADGGSDGPICYHITTLTSDKAFDDRFRAGYQADPAAKRIMDSVTSPDPSGEYRSFHVSPDGLLLQQGPGAESPRIYVPAGRLRVDLLHDHHDNKGSGHLGTAKTVNLLGRLYYWPGMSRDVKDYVRSCNSCQRNKSDITTTRGMLQPLPIPPARWHTVAMDFAGPFAPSGEGSWDMVLVVTRQAHEEGSLHPLQINGQGPGNGETILRVDRPPTRPPRGHHLGSRPEVHEPILDDSVRQLWDQARPLDSVPPTDRRPVGADGADPQGNAPALHLQHPARLGRPPPCPGVRLQQRGPRIDGVHPFRTRLRLPPCHTTLDHTAGRSQRRCGRGFPRHSGCHATGRS